MLTLSIAELGVTLTGTSYEIVTPLNIVPPQISTFVSVRVLLLKVHVKMTLSGLNPLVQSALDVMAGESVQAGVGGHFCSVCLFFLN